MKLSFLKFYRIIFILFSIFLLGDAFYRWDGFRYYGTFSEFLPGVSLAFILWCIVSLTTAVLLWLLFRLIEKCCRFLRVSISINQIVLSSGIFIAFMALVWTGKKLVLYDSQSTWQFKFGILISIIFLSLFLTWLLRDKATHLIKICHERITPLVWLFGFCFLFSVPFVSYFALSNYKEKTIFIDAKYSAVDKSRPNFILITFDALTVRDMSVYGFDKETTPFISKWAKSAAVFTKSNASANYTAPTTATLMTGKRVWTHRRFQSEAGKPVNSDTESLPSLLKNDGYYNMAFVANSLASVQELGMVDSFMVAPLSNEFIFPASLYGFIRNYIYELFGAKIKLNDWILSEDFILHRLTPDNYFKYPPQTEFPVEKVFDMFIAQINNTHYKPYFAWIHLFPPHAPFLPPEKYSGLFDPSVKFRKWKDQYRLIRPRYFSEVQQFDAGILRARYDEFIRYCDKEFERFIKELERRDYLKNTVIILSSDHGESFEHGYFTHGGPHLFEQMTHIPLIIKWQGLTGGKISDDIVDQVDIPATILDFAGIPIPSWMEGRSLIPLLRGEKINPEPVFAMNFDKNPRFKKITKGTIAVWEGDYKLIHYLEGNKSLLFNLKDDPNELNNLVDKRPEVAHHLLNLINDNLNKANKKILERE